MVFPCRCKCVFSSESLDDVLAFCPSFSPGSRYGCSSLHGSRGPAAERNNGTVRGSARIPPQMPTSPRRHHRFFISSHHRVPPWQLQTSQTGWVCTRMHTRMSRQVFALNFFLHYSFFPHSYSRVFLIFIETLSLLIFIIALLFISSHKLILLYHYLLSVSSPFFTALHFLHFKHSSWCPFSCSCHQILISNINPFHWRHFWLSQPCSCHF